MTALGKLIRALIGFGVVVGTACSIIMLSVFFLLTFGGYAVVSFNESDVLIRTVEFYATLAGTAGMVMLCVRNVRNA